MEQGEIVVYKTAQDAGLQLEVKIADETVWLSRQQLSELYGRDIKTIGKHINNALREELMGLPVVAKFATTATDGKTYQVEHYNLDMILSVGYRVKSQRGILFRRWANEVLKNYLLKGHLLNHRFEKIERKLLEHDQQFELIINAGLKPSEGIFYDGQIFDAWEFVSKLVKSARRSITLIDNYIDESVLGLLSKRAPLVKATIYTAKTDQRLKLDLQRHNKQYPPVQIHTFSRAHDRFLIIDEETVYHIGASLKDLGKKWFAFSRMQLQAKDIIEQLKQ